jgi:hypothetical protein
VKNCFKLKNDIRERRLDTFSRIFCDILGSFKFDIYIFILGSEEDGAGHPRTRGQQAARPRNDDGVRAHRPE